MIKFISSLLAAMFVLTSSPAFSISEADLESVVNDAVYYDPTSRFCSVSSSVPLIGSDNVEQGYNFFVQKGLTPEQSSGIIGNFLIESGMEPTQKQHGGGPGRGIAQWEVGGRWDTLVKYAQDRGEDPFSLGLQLEFTWYELPSNGLSELQKATTPAQAARVFMLRFERPRDKSEKAIAKRADMAQKVYDKYASTSQSTDAIATAVSSSGCAGITGSGENTKYIDGFLVYSQFDPAWKDKPYGSSTIGESGCGPTAMAMIITNLTGKQVLPPETANYAASQDLYVPGQGSKWTIAPVLAEHWGLKSQLIGANVGKIAAALQAGGLVIASGQGPLPWTRGGHIIVIRGVTADGKFKIGDSGHRDTSDQLWDPQTLISNMKDGSVYAVYK